MNCGISLLLCCLKSAPMFIQNRHYSLCLEKENFITGLLMLMWVLRAFGDEIRRWPFLFKDSNPLAVSYASSPLAQCYCQAELEKKRMYDERVCEVKRGTFSPCIGLFLLRWYWSSCNCGLQKTSNINLSETQPSL